MSCRGIVHFSLRFNSQVLLKLSGTLNELAAMKVVVYPVLPCRLLFLLDTVEYSNTSSALVDFCLFMLSRFPLLLHISNHPFVATSTREGQYDNELSRRTVWQVTRAMWVCVWCIAGYEMPGVRYSVNGTGMLRFRFVMFILTPIAQHLLWKVILGTVSRA